MGFLACLQGSDRLILSGMKQMSTQFSFCLLLEVLWCLHVHPGLVWLRTCDHLAQGSRLSPWKQKLCRKGFPGHLVLKSCLCFSLGVQFHICFKPISLGPINKRDGFPPSLATDPPLCWLYYLYGEQDYWTDPAENEFSNKTNNSFSAQYLLCFAVGWHKHYWRNKE